MQLQTTATGRPIGNLYNSVLALRNAPELAGLLAFNQFTESVVMMRPAPWLPSGAATPRGWTAHDDFSLTCWLQRQHIGVSTTIAGQAVETVSRDSSFHPVRRYLAELVWDRVARLRLWLTTYLGVNPNAYTEAVGSRWMISAVARVMQPGVKADHVLILEGPQGIGKSTALKTLAGEWFADEIAELGSKDAALQTRGAWIIELSELESISRSEMSRVKAFLSRSEDRFRPPYGRRPISSPRQCVFAGTVNYSSYLRDETGNRRFWPVTCTKIRIDELARDRDQLWAEALHEYSAGATWWLEPELERQAIEEQQARTEADPWIEEVRHLIEDRSNVSIGEVLSGLGRGRSSRSQADATRAARVLQVLGWRRYRESKGSAGVAVPPGGVALEVGDNPCAHALRRGER